MIELRVAPYCENCPRFCAATHMEEVREFTMDPLNPIGIIHTNTVVTCEHADVCSVMYDHLRQIQKKLETKKEI